MVIKALLASECVAKIYICIIVMPIKSMFFLYGWQPKALIRLALWLRQNDLPYEAALEHLNDHQLNNLVSTNTYNTSFAGYTSLYNRSDKIMIFNSIARTKCNSQVISISIIWRNFIINTHSLIIFPGLQKKMYNRIFSASMCFWNDRK